MPNRIASPSAIIAGGSIAGLAMGMMLRRRGWNVVIAERSAQELSGRGAGIVTHRQLWNALAQCGVDTDGKDGVALLERVTWRPDGSVALRMSHPQVMALWDRLFSLLRNLWGGEGYRLGCELSGVRQSPGSVIAEFADGSEIEADVLIGADGIRSAVRAQAMGNAKPLYAGYVGWRGMVEEADLPPAVHAELFEYFCFCLPPSEQIIGYPVAGDGNDLRPGHRRYNFVWYRPADAATTLVDLLTDEEGVSHNLAIPPGKIRAAHIAALREAAGNILSPQFAAVVRAAKAPFLQPIFDLDSDIIAQGRVALIGDAAFVARPHIGAGVTKACEDAVALANALAGNSNVPEALQAYQRVRLPEGKRIVQRARDLGRSLQAQMVSDEEREAAILHHTAEAVMIENASMDF